MPEFMSDIWEDDDCFGTYPTEDFDEDAAYDEERERAAGWECDPQ